MSNDAHLTLGELKAHLAALDLPDDTLVIVDGYEGGMHPLTLARLAVVFIDKQTVDRPDTSDGLFGPFELLERGGTSLAKWTDFTAREGVRALALSRDVGAAPEEEENEEGVDDE